MVRGNTSCLDDLFCAAATGSDAESASTAPSAAAAAAAAAASAAAASAAVDAAAVDAAAVDAAADAAAADVPSRTFRALWMRSAASEVLILGGCCSDPRDET